MIKALFTALTGITEDIDDDDSQASWEHQKYLDENDLDDFDFDADATDDNGDSDRAGEGFSGWFWSMVIIKYPSLSRKYRAKRKRRAISPIKTIKRFSLIAYICKAIAVSLFVCIVPLLLVILPLMLIAIAVVTTADKINQLGGALKMIKALLIASSLSLAMGAIGGYFLQKLESQPIAKDSGEAIAAIPKQIDLRPKPSKRSELELKYALCTNSKPDPRTLSRLDDKTLNDLVHQVCTKAS